MTAKKRTERTGIYRRDVVEDPTTDDGEAYIAEEAEHRRGFLDRLREAMKRLPRGNEDAAEARSLYLDLEAAMKARDVEDSVCLAVQLGMMLERMKVRRFEPDAKRGQKVAAGATSGGRERRGQTKKDPAAVVEAWMALRREQPGLKKSVIDERIAKRFGISKRTVERSRRTDR